jgi:hypothetical protein
VAVLQPQEEHHLQAVHQPVVARQLQAALPRDLVQRRRQLQGLPAEVPRLPEELVDAARRLTADRDPHPSTT